MTTLIAPLPIPMRHASLGSRADQTMKPPSRQRPPRFARVFAGLAALCLATAPRVATAQTTIPVTVTEYGNLTRTAEPVTSGVPITPDLVSASWALFDGAQEIPLQTTVLPGRSVPWLLLDFQTSLAPGQTRSLSLRAQPPAAAHAAPVLVNETPSAITVTTGRLRTIVSKTDFNLLDNVWYDRNGDGVFASGDAVVQPAITSRITVRDAASGLDYSGRGLPQRVVWEYQGPLRATLRVDGAFVRSGTTLLNYTTRLTWHAGQSSVVIEHTLRNSLEAQERWVKLSSARLDLAGGAVTRRLARSGGVEWTNVGTSGAMIQMVPATLDVSTAYAPYATPPVGRQNATIQVDANGGMVVGDLSHFGGTWVVDFADNLSGTEMSRRMAVARDPLIALADENYYSFLGAFGHPQFSTWTDEKDANSRWGWTWPTPGNTWSEEHSRPRVPDLYPSWSVVDATLDPESDDLWQNEVMFARVRIPFFLDRLRAWARYMAWEWTFRSDDFTYAGAWNNVLDGPGTVPRTPVIQPSLTAADNQFIANNVRRGKASPSHMWNAGVLDFYYLTGRRDALEAAIDVAEQARRYFVWQTQGVGGNARFPARCLLILTRTWEATNDPQWKTAADHVLSLFLQSPRYDTRGFYFAWVSDGGPSYTTRFPGPAKRVTPFMMATVVEALYRYHNATGDPAVRAQLVQIAGFARASGIDPVTGYAGDEIVVDSPVAGNVLHLSATQYDDIQPVLPYAAAPSTAELINALTIGYRLTGDTGYLLRAKYYWGQASKRGFTDPYGTTYATPTQVGRFLNSLQPWTPMSLYFPNSGDLHAVDLLFYEFARQDLTAPAAITDAQAR